MGFTSSEQTTRRFNVLIVAGSLRKVKRIMANYLKFETKSLIVRLLVEGNSIRSIERILNVHRDTVIKLLVRIGEHCEDLLHRIIRGIKANSIECDEIWAFVQKKQRRCSDLEKTIGRVGDQYTFVAMDSDTKLIISYLVGKRDSLTTQNFIQDLCGRLAKTDAEYKPQISTDGFEQYVNAIENAFGDDVDYAQVIKEYTAKYAGRSHYSLPSISNIIKKTIKGDPKAGDIGTSYVERQNLTMRMSMRRFTRLTNAFSKKLDNLKAAVALHFAYYNFCRPHRSLKGCTPAMEAGLVDHVWELDELLAGEKPVMQMAA